MNAISRRDLFRSLLGRRTSTPQLPEHSRLACTEPSPAKNSGSNPKPLTNQNDNSPQLALILDRFCLAWQGSFCSTCIERCPVPGAISTTMGKPCVNPDLCTGCRICHDVCPAPKNAVFLVPRKPGPGMIGRTVTETAPSSPT